MTGSVLGDLSPDQTFQVLHGLSHVLEKEVDWLNQLISLQNVAAEGSDMKEVKALGSSLKSMMDNIKRSASEAQSTFEAEANRALVNSDKVKSAAADLKSANLEIEQFLGETDSNFPPSAGAGSSITPTPVEYHGSNLVVKK